MHLIALQPTGSLFSVLWPNLPHPAASRKIKFSKPQIPKMLAECYRQKGNPLSASPTISWRPSKGSYSHVLPRSISHVCWPAATGRPSCFISPSHFSLAKVRRKRTAGEQGAAVAWFSQCPLLLPQPPVLVPMPSQQALSSRPGKKQQGKAVFSMSTPLGQKPLDTSSLRCYN